MINHDKEFSEQSNWANTNGYDNIFSVTGVLDASETSNSYTLKDIDKTSDFAVISNELGNVFIELTAPNGNTYTNFENGKFVYGLLGSIDNTQVYSMGERGISVSNPFDADDEWRFTVKSNVAYRSSFVVGIAEKTKHIDTNNYTIDYTIAQDWGSGQNIEVMITNTGDEPIRNWALQYNDFGGTITNIWNGVLHGENIIKNVMYNSDIAPGTSVTIGYTLSNATGEEPILTLCTFRNAKQDGYTVNVDVLSDWGSGFVGAITITNTTDTPIMAWELSFDAVDFEISGTGQFAILEDTDGFYKITGTYNGNIPIPANTNITLQFNGIKSGTPDLSSILLTEMVF